MSLEQSKKVAIIITSLNNGGAPKVMLSLANALLRLGHVPHFFLLSETNIYPISHSIPVHVCFKDKDKILKGYANEKKASQILSDKINSVETKTGKFDLFLSNSDKSDLLLAGGPFSPLYMVVHASVEAELSRHFRMGPFKYYKKWRSKQAMNGQSLVTVSEGIKQEILSKNRIKPKSIDTIYNPFDVEEIQEQSKEKNDQIPEHDYWIHIGRFVEQKRHDILFSAIQKMNNPLPVVLLCHKPEAALKLAKKYGVEDRIILPPFQLNPYPWIQKAKGLLLSSDFEGLPTVLIESLICGTPIVSTDCPHGPKEIMVNELKPYLVPRRDPSAFAQAVDALYKKPLSISHATIIEQVRAEKVAKAYISLIKSENMNEE